MLEQFADNIADTTSESSWETLGCIGAGVAAVIGARFLVPKVASLLPRLEIGATRSAASQSTKIGDVELQFTNSALTKIKFPDGGRAWHTGKYWQETFPSGTAFEGRIKPLSPKFRVENENLVRETRSEITTFSPDGHVGTVIRPEIFKVRGEVSEEIVNRYRDAYMRLPEGLRDLFANDGRIVIGRTLKEAAPELKNMTPKAHGPGVTYDHILGVALTKRDHFKVVLPEKVRSYRVDDASEFVTVGSPERTLRHEVGHVIDFYRGTLSRYPKFIKAYNKDVEKHVSRLTEQEKERLWYYLRDADKGGEIAGRRRMETFAELFASIYADLKPRPSTFKRVLNNFRKDDMSELPLIMRAFPNSRRQIERDLNRFTL